MINYSVFFRNNGVRTLGHLTSGRLRLIDDFQLPKESIVHYLPETINEIGITGDNWCIRNSERLTYAIHVESFPNELALGKFRKSKTSVASIIKDYHRKNRKIKLAKNIDKVMGIAKTYVVVNYGLIPQLYSYTQNPHSRYNSRMNLLAALATNLDSIGNVTKQNFIPIELPDTLPSLTELRRAEPTITTATVASFSSLSNVFILDLWRWLGEFRSESRLGLVSEEVLKRTNVIFKKEDRITIINLGLLQEWLGDDGDVSASRVIQKRLLNLLHKLLDTDSETVRESTKSESSDAEEGITIRELVKVTEADTELESTLDTTFTIAQESELTTNPLESKDTVSLTESFKQRIDARLENNEITVGEHKKLLGTLEKYNDIPSPIGTGKLSNAGLIKPEDLELKPKDFADRVKVLDKSMLQSTTDVFDKKYISEVMDKDIINSVTSVLKAGSVITGYEIEEVEDVVNHFTIHTVRVTSPSGKQSTLPFKIPKVQPDGTYKSNGVKYIMRKQRGDMPIRKTNPSTVALTSYFGKLFIIRDDRMVGNYSAWLLKQIKLKGVADKDKVTKIIKNKRFDYSITVPRIYSLLGGEFLGFKYKQIEFFLDYNKRKELFPDTRLSELESGKRVLIGKYKGFPLVVDKDSNFFYIENKKLVELGTVEELLDLDLNKKVIDSAVVKIFSAKIPLGFMLAYYVGLETLIKSLSATVKRMSSTVKYDLIPGEYKIEFEDTTLVLNTSDRLATMILFGLNRYAKSIKQYPKNLFDKKKVYLNILGDFNLGNSQLEEMELMRDMFIDPITEDILKEIKEPTEWLPLLKRSAELLLTDQSYKETDLRDMRIKGYERISGTVYNSLVKALRTQRRFGGPIELNPYEVWKNINSDPSITLVEESNPIKNINEREAVTFVGTGGRSKESMVGRSRVFNPSDTGTISEATVDSGDVAINTYLSANPKIKSLRGATERFDSKTDGPSNLISTAAMLSPGADRDSPNRVNFITIQHAQGISASGYEVSPIRTGYEEIIPERVGKLYCATAQLEGKVISKNKLGIVVEYTDGSRDSLSLGTKFGEAGGSTYKHVIESKLEVGDKVKPGDVIGYNTGFFVSDFFNPKRVLWKGGVMAKVALLESSETFEDSSSISPRLARGLATTKTKTRYITVGFEQSISNLVNVGDTVDTDSILCIIEDSVTSDNKLFNSENINTLKLLSGNTPRAKHAGTIEKIEVLYYGDIEYMSPTLQEIAKKSDKLLAQSRRAVGEKVVTGKLSDSLRINNTTLNIDNMVIKVYISKFETDGAGTGDKGVFGNQMKTVFGSVMSGINRTESGVDLDAFFGYISLVNRQVNSPELMGTTNTLSKVLSKYVSDVYFETK